jgi:cytochrome c5
MRTKICLRVFGSTVLAILLGIARTSNASPQQSNGENKNVKINNQDKEGEKKFQENCSRCHNAPENLSPRISGTVIRHMRVRASISQKDAEAILHYLNP